jgi:hypothetical protein
MAGEPPQSAKPSQGARVAAVILTAICGFFWIGIVPALTGLSGSDAAGNAMAQGFTAVAMFILWALLSILALIASISGAMPQWARLALLVVPASGVAALAALDLLSHPTMAPGLWPIVTPALVPPLVVVFALWSLTRPPVPASGAATLLGAIALLSLAMLPLMSVGNSVVAQQQEADTRDRDAFAQVALDAPLWALTPFLKVRDQTIVNAALARIQKLERRQADAETMLARGDFPLGYLPRFELDPTPAICDGMRALLRTRAAALVSSAPNSKPYAAIAQDVEDAVADMSWLVGYGCDCEAETHAWEDMAGGYQGTNYDLVRLRELRNPGTLGRRLRESPDKFSQLSAQSHLKAWLKFSDDEALREKIIAGMRTLDHRTADAVDILTDKYEENTRFRLMRFLPLIDLDATPALCAAAAREIGKSVREVYRPKPEDEPRRYSELIDRLGAGEPLTALIWLAEHGCDVGNALRDAEAAVRAYQGSAARTAMLETLTRLQGK